MDTDDAGKRANVLLRGTFSKRHASVPFDATQPFDAFSGRKSFSNHRIPAEAADRRRRDLPRRLDLDLFGDGFDDVGEASDAGATATRCATPAAGARRAI